MTHDEYIELIFLSTPSVRRATIPGIDVVRVNLISIHALRAEGDTLFSCDLTRPLQFLSTPSVRRATGAIWLRLFRFLISIHALRAEGDRIPAGSTNLQIISIHALRAEGDRLRMPVPPFVEFLSTPSVRRATKRLWICVHVPPNFYPRPPCGGRLNRKARAVHPQKFLSTPSVRRATAIGTRAPSLVVISIHALRAEGDALMLGQDLKPALFLSTPSVRRATYCRRSRLAGIFRFLSTPSVRRATYMTAFPERDIRISIHALRAEGDRISAK